jgi:hypothetical protein
VLFLQPCPLPFKTKAAVAVHHEIEAQPRKHGNMCNLAALPFPYSKKIYISP